MRFRVTRLLSGLTETATRHEHGDCASIRRPLVMSEDAVQLGKVLIIAGVALAIAGILVMLGAQARWPGIGRLPGDIVHRGGKVSFYFPIVTCLILSAVLTLALWVISFLSRR